MKKLLISTLVLLLTGWSSATAGNEDGSRLWLRFEAANATKAISGVKGTAMSELQTYWKGGPVVLKHQKGMAQDAYTIQSKGGKITISAANNAGLLYGAYHLLRLQQMGEDTSALNISEQPAYDRRLLTHWDNPNGTV